MRKLVSNLKFYFNCSVWDIRVKAPPMRNTFKNWNYVCDGRWLTTNQLFTIPFTHVLFWVLPVSFTCVSVSALLLMFLPTCVSLPRCIWIVLVFARLCWFIVFCSNLCVGFPGLAIMFYGHQGCCFMCAWIPFGYNYVLYIECLFSFVSLFSLSY